MKYLLLIIFSINFAFTECVHERVVLGSEIESLSKEYSVFVSNKNNQYKKVSTKNIIAINTYKVQLTHQFYGDFNAYNKKYIEYYTYPHMQDFLNSKKQMIDQVGYEQRIIGKSIKGRDLFYIGPKQLDSNKQTIVMLGRHHGDEGTANWIIEGFFNKFLSSPEFRAKYQLLLYPMINPDGAMAQTRYNENGRDLNRSWTRTSGYDEISIIHPHMKSKIQNLRSIEIVLDMHGSIREDFIYRVDKGFWNTDFYNLQQNFIDKLSRFDPWQRGNFILSNGDPGMARIRMIKDYNLNALTHETIRNIKKSTFRTKQDLFSQGEALVKALE